MTQLLARIILAALALGWVAIVAMGCPAEGQFYVKFLVVLGLFCIAWGIASLLEFLVTKAF